MVWGSCWGVTLYDKGQVYIYKFWYNFISLKKNKMSVEVTALMCWMDKNNNTYQLASGWQTTRGGTGKDSVPNP